MALIEYDSSSSPMKNESINVRVLNEQYQERCKIRIKVYDKILDKCTRYIKANADKDLTYCIYTIPKFILGIPPYNLPYCAAYIIYNLRKDDFEVKFINPNVLFIKWNFDKPKYDEDKFIEYGNNAKWDTNPITIGMSPSASHSSPSSAKSTKKIFFRSVGDYKPTGNFLVSK